MWSWFLLPYWGSALEAAGAPYVFLSNTFYLWRRVIHPSPLYIRPQNVSYQVTLENDSGPSGAPWALILGCPTRRGWLWGC